MGGHCRSEAVPCALSPEVGGSEGVLVHDASRSRARAGSRRRLLLIALPSAAIAVAAAVVVSVVLTPACGSKIAAIGCATPSLTPAAGASVVTGYGRLTDVTRSSFGTRLHEFEITRVEVLGGSARAGSVHGWLLTVPSPGPDLAAAQVPGMWAPDGHVLAYVPADASKVAEASTLRVWPIVDGRVVFSAAACGAAPSGLPTTKFNGPLTEVPDSRSFAVAQCNGGFVSSPLQAVRRLL